VGGRYGRELFDGSEVGLGHFCSPKEKCAPKRRNYLQAQERNFGFIFEGVKMREM
jgi:hypothetical protein